MIPCCQVDRVHQHAAGMLVEAHTTTSGATCPLCGMVSSFVHSYYTRTLQDLPISETVMCLKVKVRRFRCRNEHCRRRTFTETLTPLTERYARRTMRLNAALWHIGQVAGGQGGAYLAGRLHMPTTRYTVLRLLRRQALPSYAEPRIVGVDDWAKRRGQSYGTIVVDLERHQVLDLLPERTPDVLAQWLAQRPGIEIVTRDRSGEYALGIQTGAPHARQVADRWHLFRNLSDMTERALQDVLPALRQQSSRSASTNGARRERFPRAQVDLKRQQDSRKRRLRLYQRIQYLKQQGYSQRRITRALDVSRGTVRRYFKATEFPETKPRYVASMIDPYLDYLEQRFTAGCTQASQLWREIRTVGYPGTPSQVSKWAQNRRKQGLAEPAIDISTASAIALPSSKTCLWLLTSDPARLKADERLLLDQLQQVEVLHVLYQLIQRFAVIIREHRADLFDEWLADAAASEIAACVRFAASLKQDYGAVKAGLELPWSNGQTEGQVHRLKLLKRQMYGRAKLDLLRLRMLYART